MFTKDKGKLQEWQNIFCKSFLFKYFAINLSNKTTRMPFVDHIFNVRQIAKKAKAAGSKKSNIYEHLNFTLNNDALLGTPQFIDEIKAVVEKDCKRLTKYLDKHKEKLEELEKNRRKA